jgi:protein-disulfide isomerase
VETKYPHACRVAYAAEAAGRLGGPESYWEMHTWLLANRERFSDAALRAAAIEIGLDADAYLRVFESPEVQAAIARDTALGQRLQVTKVPTVFVNGRKVPRWKLDEENVLPRILAAAADR